jgi:hypothetical protein
MAVVIDGTTGITTPGVSNSGTMTQTGAATMASTLQTATTIGVGAATPATSGAGITFPATQSASTDANTLDDYEEGTWTPNIGGNATYSAQTGQYIKIGNQVTVWYDLTVATVGTGNNSQILGLPFTSGGNTQGKAGGVSYWQSLASTLISLSGRVDLSSTLIQFGGATAATANYTASVVVWGAGARVIGFNTYTVA